MLTEGLTNLNTVIVTESLTASALGSGDLPVLATPAMIAGMENVCMNCVKEHLEDGQTTVGTRISVSHLSATPVGDTVTYTCALNEVDGRSLRFIVCAFDSAGKIGEGIHERFIVTSDRFLEKAKAKLK